MGVLKLGSLSHCRRNLASAFRTHIINSPKETESLALQSPVRVMGSCSFMYMRHNDVYLLAVTKNNANVMLAFQFMTQVRMLPPKPCHWAVGWHVACRGASACRGSLAWPANLSKGMLRLLCMLVDSAAPQVSGGSKQMMPGCPRLPSCVQLSKGSPDTAHVLNNSP